MYDCMIFAMKLQAVQVFTQVCFLILNRVSSNINIFHYPDTGYIRIFGAVVALGMCKVCKCTGAPPLLEGPPVADLENFGGGDFKHKTSRFFGRKRKFKPSGKTFFFFFWRSPDFWRKKGLNVEKPLLISVKTFFFWRSPDFERKKGLNVEKPLLISVKTYHLILCEKKV